MRKGEKRPWATPHYETRFGRLYQGDCEDVLSRYPVTRRHRKVQLLFTSPPFPLNHKKKYGNLTGQAYVDWLASLGPLFSDYITDDGSIVIELGNAWVPGSPTMSTLPLQTLLRFLSEADLHLCQEFIFFNPARLPSPAQWVTVERIRVKDAFTRVWWMAKSERPKADNRRVLTEYSDRMKKLLRTGTYNSGRRPSDHRIGTTSFLTDNGGAIPPNVIVPPLDQVLADSLELLSIPNTSSDDAYQRHCRDNGVSPHPARMAPALAEFFIEFLSDAGDLVLDPFAGSNTTGWMAEKLRRRWLSIEADAGYASASSARFGASTQTLVLSPAARASRSA